MEHFAGDEDKEKTRPNPLPTADQVVELGLGVGWRALKLYVLFRVLFAIAAIVMIIIIFIVLFFIGEYNHPQSYQRVQQEQPRRVGDKCYIPSDKHIPQYGRLNARGECVQP